MRGGARGTRLTLTTMANILIAKDELLVKVAIDCGRTVINISMRTYQCKHDAWAGCVVGQTAMRQPNGQHVQVAGEESWTGLESDGTEGMDNEDKAILRLQTKILLALEKATSRILMTPGVST